MSYDRSGSVVSSAMSDNFTQNHVRECVQRWETRLEENRPLEAGFEQGRRTPSTGAPDPMDLQQREDAIHQLWFQSARERILQIDRLEQENLSLKDQVAYGVALDDEIHKLTELLEDKDAELDEIMLERTLVIQPYLEQVSSEVEFLKLQNNELSMMTASRDQVIDALALENQSLRDQLQQACELAGISLEAENIASPMAFDESDSFGATPGKEQPEHHEYVRDAAEEPGIGTSEQALELHATKRQLLDTEKQLKDARSELEIANHHLQLRKESIVAMEATRLKSSITGFSLFEAEACIRNDLEIQRDNLESELQGMRKTQAELEDCIANLGIDIMIDRSDKRKLRKALANANLQCSYLTTERDNLETSHATLRKCFQSATTEIQQKDAIIATIEKELDHQNGMIMTLSSALSNTRRVCKETKGDLNFQTALSRRRGGLLAREKKEHQVAIRELQRKSEQLDRVRSNLVRAHVGRNDGFDATLADKRFLERELEKADETTRGLEKQLDLTRKQLSGERELLNRFVRDVNEQIDDLEREKKNLQDQMKSIDGNNDGMVGAALLGGGLIGLFGQFSQS